MVVVQIISFAEYFSGPNFLSHKYIAIGCAVNLRRPPFHKEDFTLDN